MARAFEAPYVNRALVESIARAADPIVILEGPCGVGKTSLVRNEPALRGYHYVTLANEEVFAHAVRQPLEWVSSLSRPAIIDDAHRIESLVAVVQQVAPKKLGDAPVFILVSSRVLRDRPKEGATADAARGPKEKPAHAKKARKPLKPRRFTLFPLTQAELHEREGCVVDDLFDRDPLPDFHSAYLRSDLRTMMRIGGFPHYATHPVCTKIQERSVQIQESLRVMLEDDVGPKADIERSIERSVLKQVLTNPGLSLGVGTLARACYVDVDTVSAHLDTFVDRFLVHRLSGIVEKQGRKRTGARTRVHAMDTTFVVEAMRAAGHDIAVEPAMFGKVLRTLCVNQLVPAAQWSSEPTECHHWWKFDRRVRAVDLVLLRNDRMIGIKVRNCATARSDTMGALKFMAEDERFVRGFIVYAGAITMQLADNVWAIPVSALWEREAFWPRKEEGEDDPDENGGAFEEELAEEELDD